MQTLQIRNSTAEFLIFTKQNKEKTIEVIVDEESVWLSQKLMAELFGTTRNNITMHLSNIFEKELSEDSVCKEFLHTARDEKNYKTKYYNLDVIIAKNYLTKEELKSLERIVTMYLDYAEDQAERHIPMIMEELEE